MELEISMDNARIFLKNELSGFSSRNAFSALFVCAIQTCIVSFAVSQYVYLIVFEVAGSGMYFECFIFRKLKNSLSENKYLYPQN